MSANVTPLVSGSIIPELERVLSREIERTSGDLLDRIVRALEMLRVIATLK